MLILAPDEVTSKSRQDTSNRLFRVDAQYACCILPYLVHSLHHHACSTSVSLRSFQVVLFGVYFGLVFLSIAWDRVQNFSPHTMLDQCNNTTSMHLFGNATASRNWKSHRFSVLTRASN